MHSPHLGAIKTEVCSHIENAIPESPILSDEKATAVGGQRHLFDPSVERSLNRKYDMRILPLLFLLYFFSFMDRSSIGNASIAGLNKDLKLVGHNYNTALALFFVCYMIVDIPAALAFKWIGPRYFLSGSIFCFGLCTICLGFVTKASQLYAVRCLLGLCEGGLTPCLFLYMGLFYGRENMQRRMAWFYIAAPMSGALGGLMASGLGQIRVGNYRAWPWIFFVEGAITMVVGVICLLGLPNFPSQCRFLTEPELELAKIRAGGVRGRVNVDQEKEKISWRKIKYGFLDWNTAALALSSTGSYCNIYAYSLFSPTIIKSFGFSTIHSQLFSVPPYFVAVIIILTSGYLSDHLRLRGPFMIGACAVQAIGWIINITCKTIAVRYFGLFLIAAGAFNGITPMTTWLTGNLHPHYVRAVGMSFSVSMGTAGGIIATFTYVSVGISVNTGNGVQLGMCGLTALCAAFLMWKNNTENKLRARGGRDYRLSDPRVPEEELGSRHPSFVLSL